MQLSRGGGVRVNCVAIFSCFSSSALLQSSEMSCALENLSLLSTGMGVATKYPLNYDHRFCCFFRTSVVISGVIRVETPVIDAAVVQFIQSAGLFLA